MIRDLYEADRQAIRAYLYQRERENMFAIGAFGRPQTFEQNRFIGYEEGGKLRGVATVFLQHESFVAHAEEPSLLDALTDTVMKRKIPFVSIPAFRRYADPMVARLRDRYGLTPKSISQQTVFVLPRERFTPVVSDAVIAEERDREDCARMVLDGPLAVLTEQQFRNVIPAETMVLHRSGTVVARANIHALSQHYAQIGGVATLPAFRRQGLGRQCVSALCSHCFAMGKEAVILFTADTNVPAQGLYRSLGFEPTDAFLIAVYDTIASS